MVVSGQGDLACVTRDGKIAWSVNYYQKYNATIQRFGISESPLVVDNKVIATPGGNMASMVAFNIENGSVVWETPPLNEGTQYTNPLLIEDKGMKVIVTHTVTYIIGVNARDGKLLWKFNFAAVNDDQKGGRNYHSRHLFTAMGFFLQQMVTGRLLQRLKLPLTEANQHLSGRIRKSIPM